MMVTVKASQGQSFTLDEHIMKNTDDNFSHHCAYRDDVRAAFQAKRPITVNHVWWSWKLIKRENGSVRIGCLCFSPAQAAKLRKWAMGAKKRGKR